MSKNIKIKKLVDLKKGDKYYSHDWEDDSVYELLELIIIHGDNNRIIYKERKIGTDVIISHEVQGLEVVNHAGVCMYRGRDKGSFISGFKAAMRLYQKYMQVFDKENAGLNNHFLIWKTMHEEYEKWKVK
jgi:hypothetical protein